MRHQRKDGASRIRILRLHIATLHGEGLTREEIAARIGRTPPAVGYHTKAMGLTFTKGRRANVRANQ